MISISDVRIPERLCLVGRSNVRLAHLGRDYKAFEIVVVKNCYCSFLRDLMKFWGICVQAAIFYNKYIQVIHVYIE